MCRGYASALERARPSLHYVTVTFSVLKSTLTIFLTELNFLTNSSPLDRLENVFVSLPRQDTARHTPVMAGHTSSCKSLHSVFSCVSLFYLKRSKSFVFSVALTASWSYDLRLQTEAAAVLNDARLEN